MNKEEMVNHPSHYNEHPSGVECIDIIEHMNFCLGNAIKYIWRASLKGNEIEDLKKAQFYLTQEIKRLESKKSTIISKKIPNTGRSKDNLVAVPKPKKDLDESSLLEI